MTDDSEISKAALGATLLGEYGSASYQLGQTLVASDTDPTTAFKARDRALEAVLVFMRRREDEVDHLTTVRDYFMAESKSNADAATGLHERNLELDQINGDLHDQIRAKDAEILRLKDDLNARQGTPEVYDAAMNGRDDEITRLQSENERLAELINVHELEIAKLVDHTSRQEHMLDNATILLETGASMIGTAQVALDKAEAALTEARMQRDFNARSIDMLSADIATLQKITRDPDDKRVTRDQLRAELGKLGVLAKNTELGWEKFERFAGAYAALNWAMDPTSFTPVSGH